MAGRAASHKPSLRRSARLNNTLDDLGRLEGRKGPEPRSMANIRKCTLNKGNHFMRARNSSATSALIIKSEVFSGEELSRRANTLNNGERELKKRKLALADREANLEKTLAKREAQSILKHLDEYFTCSLCFEIIACPYMLSTVACGHSFCAICTIKWFFSRLHRGCGAWHESVACPLCRSLLAITPDVIPRSFITVPFALNRLADKSIMGMIERLRELCNGPKSYYKRRIDSHPTCKIDGARIKLEESVPQRLDESALEHWGEGGMLRKEWIDRDRIGRVEMNDLIARWAVLTGAEFIKIRERLGL